MSDFKGITQDALFLMQLNRFNDSKAFYDENKEKIKATELQSLYTADDGNTQVFALTEATATFSSFQAAPRVVRW